MRYQTVALIGGSGFIGTYVVARLLRTGHQVRIAVRRRAHAGHLQMLPVTITECDVHDPAQLAAFIDGADAVVNLVGILQDTRQRPYGPNFRRVHVELPRKIVAACAQARVRRLLHMSALGADPQGPSMYLRSKGDGENIVAAAGGPPTNLLTTIFRPSVVFGPGDKFLQTFADLQKLFPVIPLASPTARFQPVFAGDVARAIVTAIDLDGAVGKAFELGGPRVYTLAELVRFAGSASGHPRRIVGLPDWAARLQGAVFEHLPNAPISRDNIDSMTVPSVLSAPIDPMLHIVPVSVESVAGAYLGGRAGGHRVTAEAALKAAAAPGPHDAT
ncbi:complex I NDUFA9 subunit family protein [Robbsia sp. Bb-Pol-6]|uniref:Complex I NDUFA9 subunit family protein n=1 Tax=Robbsia betulipollinis TaxID=2981849 RepID=A0ABT3ZLX2_9BURK|nr:complex I NDUFA9 subunit family protein [Robbsia betulipollinis]MCY0386943.1 complex I NDUFA9 subunit family protein [Robbsia betulipollinis]